MKYIIGLLSVLYFVFGGVHISEAATVAQTYSGRIIVSTDTPTEFWYVDPRTKNRYAATTLTDIRKILRTRAEKITTTQLNRIPKVGASGIGNVAYRNQMAGRFLVVTNAGNQAWYVLPTSKRRILLGIGGNAVTTVHRQAKTITPTELSAIQVPANIDFVSSTVKTTRGTFTVERLEFSWNDPTLKIMMDTANTADCKNGCSTLSLGSFIARRSAVAGLHGTYFCPGTYPQCVGKTNSYDFPVWNSFTKSWRNESRLKYTIQPLVAFDTSNRPFLYPETLRFKSDAAFTSAFHEDSLAAGGTGILQGAFSNGPVLMKNGAYVLRGNQLDTKQATAKGFRGGIGWKGTKMVMFVARSATVYDLGAVAQALQLDNAVNLDGGGSTAMFNDGRYLLGPGRGLPNAILLMRR